MIELKNHEMWLLFGSLGAILSTPILIFIGGYNTDTLIIPFILIFFNIIIYIIFDCAEGILKTNQEYNYKIMEQENENH